MSIIDELWYGNISPCDGGAKKESEYAELLGYVARHKDELQKRLNGEEKEILEKLIDCTNEMYGISEREAFAQGFTLGARLVIEVMTAELE